MDSVARLDLEERRALFNETAAQIGFAPWVAEKDFWVCWILKRLFDLPSEFPAVLFKGGTSLSKAFGVIKRFSEDIDLSVSRADLGFGDDSDFAALSGKKRQTSLAELDNSVREFVHATLLLHLRESFSRLLTEDTNWSLNPVDDGPDLRFEYPVATEPALGYSSPSILVEIGARSAYSPAGTYDIHPYAYDAFPDYFVEPSSTVTVLAAERTFWEKVTILNAFHHGGVERASKERLSRHYYDLYQLLSSAVGRNAIGRLDLLEEVRDHKTLFYRSAWARYDEAVPGPLRLKPPEEVRRIVERDYEDMNRAGYFYGEPPPPFPAILEALGQAERLINR